jgi:signal peptidase I
MGRRFSANKGFLVLLMCFGIFRTAIADWNPIPSGSMRPSLLEGDVVFVNRLAYNVKVPLTDVVLTHTGEPQRGDVVTFSSPRDGMRLIKRLVAVPGDTVEMRDEMLFINGEAARYDAAEALQESIAGGAVDGTRLTEQVQGHRRRVQWLHGVAAHRSFGPVTVPEGKYLMLGDNRDDSADSRYFGFVPRHLLIGRALGVLVSADIKSSWMPRLERFGQKL